MESPDSVASSVEVRGLRKQFWGRDVLRLDHTAQLESAAAT